jgi:hypothetical protein
LGTTRLSRLLLICTCPLLTFALTRQGPRTTVQVGCGGG